MNPSSITQQANAKINLYLHVTGKRDDGFHELDSLVVFADIGDSLSVRATPDSRELTFKTSGPFGADVPIDDSNLVLKAAKLLRDSHDVKMGAEILLEKNLPPSSGIGGGSADAAAVVRVLSILWNLKTPALDSNTLSAKLGADVPVCMQGKNVFMAGIGEILTPAPKLPECWLVLANPGREVSTPEVFKGRSGEFSSQARFDQAPATAAQLAEIIAGRGNDLFQSAKDIAPEIGDVMSALQKLDGALLARMSGSGATCFAIFAGQALAQTGAKQLGKDNPNWWVRAARMLNPD